MTTLRNSTDTLQSALRFIFYGVIALLVLFYAYYQSRNLLAGSYLAFESPKNDSIVTDSVVTITGEAARIAFIKLNGRQIFVDGTGVFKEKLPLLPGHNIIQLHATDRFGRVTTKELYLTYEKD